jgi:hypothetical protein
MIISPDRIAYGSTQTIKVSFRPSAAAVTSQQPAVRKYNPLAWKRVG